MSNMITFDVSKLHIEEVTCHACGDTHCTKTECIFDSKKLYSQDGRCPSYLDITKKNLGKKGVQVPSVRPIDMVPEDNLLFQQTAVGQFENYKMKRILGILNTLTDSHTSSVDSLREFIETFAEPSLVGMLDSDEEILRPDVRDSISIDFDEDIVSELSPIIKDKILESFDKTPYPVDDVVIHPDHGSIILYNKVGSEFKIHRDKVLECPITEANDMDYSWEMYSIVICLDSNLNDRIRSNEGNTIVYLPPINEGSKFISCDSIEKYKCVPHIFNDSVIPSQFVVFPSIARHRSVPLSTEGAYKLILKMDCWVKINRNMDNHYNLNPFRFQKNLTLSTQLCNCKSCDPFRQRIPVYLYHHIQSTNIPEGVIQYIMKFIDYNDFVSHKYIEVDVFNSELHDRIMYEEWDSPYDDEVESYCNGGRHTRRRYYW